MTAATERARALLAAETLPKGRPTPRQWRDRAKARQEIKRLGFTPATLAVAIKLAEGLGKAGPHSPVEETDCAGCTALAAWQSHMGEGST